MAGIRQVLVLGAALSLAAGCYQGTDAVGDDIAATRSEHFNTTNLNGLNLNGLNLNGSKFSAVFKVGKKHVYRHGTDFIGAEFEITATGLDENGNEVSEDFILRIDDIFPDPNWDDVLLYDMSYRPAGVDSWQPLCDDGGPVIPLNNYWDLETGDRIDDPNVVTFACTNAVLAKCVEWGYRPWATAE
ncbi:MAG TPA: ADYC domain-containing protein, partial [Nannocystis sp.]